MQKIKFYGRIAGTMFAVGCLTVILWNYTEFFWFFGAPAALGIVLSFAKQWHDQREARQIESIGTGLR